MENYFESQRENIFQHCEAELDDVGGHTKFDTAFQVWVFLIEATTQSGLFIFGWCEKPYGGSQLIASVKTRSHDIPPIGHIGPHP